MTLTLTQSARAIGPRNTASFYAKGGVEPYLFEVKPGGAGGSVNPETGYYTAPNGFHSSPAQMYDEIIVTDYAGAMASTRIMVGSPLMLLCEIIQSELGLSNGRVYVWDQKLPQPKDSGLYVAVSVPSVKPFGASNRYNPTTNESEQFVSVQAAIEVDIISRGPDARDRKEEIILALDSDYSRRQQDANSFSIGRLSNRFINLSEVDGAAIPYRYKASFQMQYAFVKYQETEYFDTFPSFEVTVDELPSVAAPTFSFDSGEYFQELLLELSTETEDASIHYTLDGTEPNVASPIYTAPISINASVTVKAIADKHGFKISRVSQADFVLKAAKPTASPIGGLFETEQTISLSTTMDGAAIFWRIGAGEFQEYTTPLLIKTTSTLQFYAAKTGWQNSDVAEELYEIDAPYQEIIDAAAGGQDFCDAVSNVGGSAAYCSSVYPGETSEFLSGCDQLVIALITDLQNEFICA